MPIVSIHKTHSPSTPDSQSKYLGLSPVVLYVMTKDRGILSNYLSGRGGSPLFH